MKIQYTQFALNPALRGTTTDLPQHRAQALIDSGAAVEIPMPPRGSKNWHARMAENERERVALIPADQRQSAPSPVPVWSVHFVQGSNTFVVKRNHLTEEIVYGARMLFDRGRPDFKLSTKVFVENLKKAGCPKEVIDRYVAAANAPDYLAAERERIEQDKRNAEDQREREKHAPRFI